MSYQWTENVDRFTTDDLKTFTKFLGADKENVRCNQTHWKNGFFQSEDKRNIH